MQLHDVEIKQVGYAQRVVERLIAEHGAPLDTHTSFSQDRARTRRVNESRSTRENDAQVVGTRVLGVTCIVSPCESAELDRRHCTKFIRFDAALSRAPRDRRHRRNDPSRIARRRDGTTNQNRVRTCRGGGRHVIGCLHAAFRDGDTP